MSDEPNEAGRPKGLPSFVETAAFTAQWARLGLADHDLRALQVALLANTTIGAVVAGTNGVRKMRFAAPGSARGKSGAYRVFYLNVPEHGHIALWGVIDKSVDENLTPADRKLLASRVVAYKARLK